MSFSTGEETVWIAVVYDSGSQGRAELRGRTATLAAEIAAGAGEVVGSTPRLICVADGGAAWDQLAGADAIVFGCPTYMGSGSAAFKSFMEDSFVQACREQVWKDRLAGVFTNSAGRSGDKLAPLIQLAVFAAQHGMVIVSLGEMPGHITSDGGEHQVNRLSLVPGFDGQSNADQGPDATPPAARPPAGSGRGSRGRLTAGRLWGMTTGRWGAGNSLDRSGASQCR
ncbi:MAG: flavodoxin family protein [Solirubrobacterales bacterium]|nr:flavodoxin family protein [Solirubrobacterales bacterium]